MNAMVFTPADEQTLRERGVSLQEARRQLHLLERSTGYQDLVRSCTVGDGIDRIPVEEHAGLIARHADAATAGRFVKFVPASGAASRMFRSLLHFQRGDGRDADGATILRQVGEGSPEARELAVFLRELVRFPFYGELKETVRRRGHDLDALVRDDEFRPILDALLAADGMNYAGRPKALLAFHRDAESARTPFEEHLVEAAHYARAGNGECRLHFTVSPEHRAALETLASGASLRQSAEPAARFEIEFTVQKPSTDTLVGSRDGGALRDEEGHLRFRPGGHGALIENLNDLQADLVFVKNIDNVQPDHLKRATLDWKRILAGYLVSLQDEVFRYLDLMRRPEPSDAIIEEAAGFAMDRLHIDLEGHPAPDTFQCRRALLLDRLNRPLRVCGVVRNTGEPGGGPFWVRGRDGLLTLQIVETAQIDPSDEQRQLILNSSTHFNPVDLVCGVSDSSGKQFDLTQFIDRDAVIVTGKSEDGREIRALELPGLWNGAMADSITVFVEVPIETFSPVKTVLDLLRDEHQPE
jgi:hypothetical protein